MRRYRGKSKLWQHVKLLLIVSKSTTTSCGISTSYWLVREKFRCCQFVQSYHVRTIPSKMVTIPASMRPRRDLSRAKLLVRTFFFSFDSHQKDPRADYNPSLAGNTQNIVPPPERCQYPAVSVETTGPSILGEPSFVSVTRLLPHLQPRCTLPRPQLDCYSY